MLPHGTRHILKSEPDAWVTPLTEVPVQLITDRYERMNFGGGGVRPRSATVVFDTTRWVRSASFRCFRSSFT